MQAAFCLFQALVIQVSTNSYSESAISSLILAGAVYQQAFLNMSPSKVLLCCLLNE
jgi:hypothetical protein